MATLPLEQQFVEHENKDERRHRQNEKRFDDGEKRFDEIQKSIDELPDKIDRNHVALIDDVIQKKMNRLLIWIIGVILTILLPAIIYQVTQITETASRADNNALNIAQTRSDVTGIREDLKDIRNALISPK